MESINVVGALHETGDAAQGSSPDSKCKLNISLLLTLPHLLGCFICTRNSILITLLLQMMAKWDRWVRRVVDLYQDVCEGAEDDYYHIVLVFFLVLLSFVLSCPQPIYLGN